MLHSLRDKETDEKLEEEMKRCIRLGSVRSDWRREAFWLEERKETAGGYGLRFTIYRRQEGVNCEFVNCNLYNIE